VFRADIVACNERIDHEQRLAAGAPSEEAAMVHLQMVMLFKSQLTMLHRKRAANGSTRVRAGNNHGGALSANPC
jgi:hypothetical protein